MKNIFTYFVGLGVLCLTIACEKPAVDPVQQQDEVTDTLNRRAINQVLVVGAEWDGVKCEVAGTGCLNAYPMRLFNGSLNEAISYVENEGPESCVSYVRVTEEGDIEIELVYASEGFEQQIKESPTNFNEFVVGPEDVHLDEEIAAALEVETITIPVGSYLIDRTVGERYWNGTINTGTGALFLPIILTDVHGGADCVNGSSLASYGVDYTVEALAFNQYYLGVWGGLDIEITTLAGVTVVSAFDPICLDPDRFRTSSRSFVCGASGQSPLAANTSYRMQLSLGANKSAWFTFTTPSANPCFE